MYQRESFIRESSDGGGRKTRISSMHLPTCLSLLHSCHWFALHLPSFFFSNCCILSVFSVRFSEGAKRCFCRDVMWRVVALVHLRANASPCNTENMLGNETVWLPNFTSSQSKIQSFSQWWRWMLNVSLQSELNVMNRLIFSVLQNNEKDTRLLEFSLWKTNL